MVLSTPSNGAVKIRIEGATKTYQANTGPVRALEDFSLDIREGELVTRETRLDDADEIEVRPVISGGAV